MEIHQFPTIVSQALNLTIPQLRQVSAVAIFIFYWTGLSLFAKFCFLFFWLAQGLWECVEYFLFCF